MRSRTENGITVREEYSNGSKEIIVVIEGDYQKVAKFAWMMMCGKYSIYNWQNTIDRVFGGK